MSTTHYELIASCKFVPINICVCLRVCIYIRGYIYKDISGYNLYIYIYAFNKQTKMGPASNKQMYIGTSEYYLKFGGPHTYHEHIYLFEWEK